MNKYLVAFTALYLGILAFLFVEQTYYDQPSWRTIPNHRVRSWSSTLSTILVIQTVGILYYMHQRGELTLKMKVIAGVMTACVILLTVLNALIHYHVSDSELRFSTRFLKAIFGLCATMLISAVLQHSFDSINEAGGSVQFDELA